MKNNVDDISSLTLMGQKFELVFEDDNCKSWRLAYTQNKGTPVEVEVYVIIDNYIGKSARENFKWNLRFEDITVTDDTLSGVVEQLYSQMEYRFMQHLIMNTLKFNQVEPDHEDRLEGV